MMADSINAANLNYHLDAEPFIGSENILSSNIENKELLFTLHNKVGIRGRTASVHIDLLENLYHENLALLELLGN